MMMKNFGQLYDGWLAGTLSKEEIDLFLDQLEQHPDYPGLIDATLDNSQHKGLGNPELMEKLYSRIMIAKDNPKTPVRKLFPAAMKWAAAILVMVAAGTAWWLTGAQEEEAAKPVVAMQDGSHLLPGGNKAILLLGDGEKVMLDSAANGELAQQGGALIYKTAGGQLDYVQSAKDAGSKKNVYNTLYTPRGGQYKLTLPDGSKVWLNAASSIRYPTAFNGDERKVTITGEAYFEVAKAINKNGKSKKPFIVMVEVPGIAGNARSMEITVLGTHFNVNAYADEPLARATLLEGSIKLKKGEDQYLMQPGQQAQLETGGLFRISADINSDEVLAWKNGYFIFDHTDLQTVMRQIARWYDVSIEYRGNVPDFKFGGDIPRNAKLDDVLEILKVSKLQFLVEGRKIIVIP